MHDFHQALTAAFDLIARGDPELLEIVALSLRVSMTATFIACLIGAPLGALLAVSRFPGRRALIVLVNALLGLPPVVVGLAVYLLLSHSGLFGDLSRLFTPTAMVIAQVILATPIVMALMHRMVDGLWSQYGDHMRVDGVSPPRAALEMLRIARAGMLTAFLYAFGRAISEVGAIIVVGGNIRGVTRTMTTAIALETSKGELALALGLGLILVSISIAVSAAGFTLHRATTRD